MSRRFILFILLATLFSCKKNKKTAVPNFYYWKTIYTLDSFSKRTMETNSSTKLYIRFFDVILDEGRAIPNEIITFNDPLPKSVSCIPVIYLRNEVFTRIKSDAELNELAHNCYTLISKIIHSQHISIQEIQFDCDWSLTTKKTYFEFLKRFKKNDSSKNLSVTIRLHQVKYKEKTGIPPADKYVLMFYNMGDLENSRQNSIYDYKTSEKYISYLSTYPHEMAIALPLFSWRVHIRSGKVLAIHPFTTIGFDQQSQLYSKISTNLYSVSTSHFSDGTYYMIGDQIKLERISEIDLKSMVSLIRKNQKKTIEEIIYYHLDSALIKQFHSSLFSNLAREINH